MVGGDHSQLQWGHHMSDQLTSQSRSNESGITRRTALRGAAWSASAVTVVVAAPAHANTSGATPTGTASTNGSTRDGSKLSLKSLFTAGPQQVSGLAATVTVGTGTMSSITTPAGWTLTGQSGSTATFTYIGNLAGGAGAAFAPVVTLSNNPDTTVTSTINFTWTKTGSAAVSIPLAYVAPTSDSTRSNRAAKNLYPVVTFTAGYSITGLKTDIVVNTGSDAIVGQWMAANGWTKGSTTGTTGTYSYTATTNGAVAQGQQVTFAPQMVLDKNPDATVTVTINLSWTGGALAPITITLPK